MIFIIKIRFCLIFYELIECQQCTKKKKNELKTTKATKCYE